MIQNCLNSWKISNILGNSMLIFKFVTPYFNPICMSSLSVLMFTNQINFLFVSLLSLFIFWNISYSMVKPYSYRFILNINSYWLELVLLFILFHISLSCVFEMLYWFYDYTVISSFSLLKFTEHDEFPFSCDFLLIYHSLFSVFFEIFWKFSLSVYKY